MILKFNFLFKDIFSIVTIAQTFVTFIDKLIAKFAFLKCCKCPFLRNLFFNSHCCFKCFNSVHHVIEQVITNATRFLITYYLTKSGFFFFLLGQYLAGQCNLSRKFRRIYVFIYGMILFKLVEMYVSNLQNI